MDTILVCNALKDELIAIRSALGSRYTVKPMISWDHKPIDPKGLDGIILDSNFTSAQGLDFLMEVSQTAHIPVLLITDLEDPQCAIESRRLGAFNYLVKTEKLASVIELAVREMLLTFNDQEELKRTVVSLKQRVAQLEAQLGSGDEKVVDNFETPSDPEQKRKELLQEIVRRLGAGEINLPSFPRLRKDLTTLMATDADMGQVAALIKKDMAVSAKLIGVANSPHYAGIRPRSTVEQAITVLGLGTTSNYVDVIINRAMYAARKPKYKPMLQALWLHGVACANASQLIAVAAQLPRPNDVFFMGLMHDIGKLLLIQTISEIETMNASDADSSLDQVSEFVHRQHGVFGRKLLDIWKLPQENGFVAQHHESPDQAPSVSKELFAVHLGNLLAKKAGYGEYDPEKDDPAIEKSLAALNLQAPEVDKALAELSQTMKNSGLSFS